MCTEANRKKHPIKDCVHQHSWQRGPNPFFNFFQIYIENLLSTMSFLFLLFTCNSHIC